MIVSHVCVCVSTKAAKLRMIIRLTEVRCMKRVRI